MDDERSIKLKWSVLGILGIVYLSLGIAFIAATVGVQFVPSDKAKEVLTIVFGSMGAFWTVFGGIFFAVEMSRRKKMRDAFLNGRKIFAEYDHSAVNRNIRKVTGHPYNVFCRWIDENQEIHIFKSTDIDFNPDSLLQGKTIPVYVNPDDYRAYYVDLDCVLPMEHIHTHNL